MISRYDFVDCGAHSLDNAGAFVPKNDWQRNRIDLIANDKICVAHTGRNNPHQNFVGTRLFNHQGFDLEWAAFTATTAASLRLGCVEGTKVISVDPKLIRVTARISF
jgi:hypothetical protein